MKQMSSVLLLLVASICLVLFRMSFQQGVEYDRVFTWGRKSPAIVPILKSVSDSTVLQGEIVVKVASTYRHVLALTNNGSLFIWGDNTASQVTDGSTRVVYQPLLVNTESFNGTVTHIAATSFHSFVVTSDNVVYKWGDWSSSIPEPFSWDSTDRQVAQISGRVDNMIVRTESGKLYGWGRNDEGQVGDGTTNWLLNTNVLHAALVTLQAIPISHVDVGTYHTVTVGQNGRVYAWGSNMAGEIGNGANSYQELGLPNPVGGLLLDKIVVDAIAGDRFSCALTNDSQVYVWGYIGFVDPPVNSPLPVRLNLGEVLSEKNITKLVSGDNHVMFVTSDGDVFGLGGNGNGQLCDLTISPSEVPTQVQRDEELDNEIIIDTATTPFHTVALTESGKVLTCGSADYGQLGYRVNEQSPQDSIFTEEMTSPFAAYAFGLDLELALDTNGSLLALGNNLYGQLASGSSELYAYDVTRFDFVPFEGKVVDIAASDYHVLALTSGGLVFAWGRNSDGQLGDGTTIDKNEPSLTALNGNNITQIATSTILSAAVTNEGRVYLWGKNIYNGNPIPQPFLVQELLSVNVKQLVLGLLEIFALDENGIVYELSGTGFYNYSAPGEPFEFVTISQIAAGNQHALARTNEGYVYGWGLSNEGQLGFLPNPTRRLGPHAPRLITLESVPIVATSIAAGTQFSAIYSRNASAIYTFGSNEYGQLGNDVRTYTADIRDIAQTTIFSQVSPGENSKLHCTNYNCVFMVKRSLCFGVYEDSDSVCSGRGRCLETDLCSCIEGYTGLDCNMTSCYTISATNSSVCSGNGNCTEFDSCVCEEGYLGLECELTVSDSSNSLESLDSIATHSASSGLSDSSSLNSYSNLFEETSTTHTSTPTLEETLLPSEMEETLFPSKREETLFPSEREETLSPSEREETVVASKREETLFPSEREETLSPSEREETLSPSEREETVVASKSLSQDVSSSIVQISSGNSASQFSCNGLLPSDSNICRGHGFCQSQDMCVCEQPYYGNDCEKEEVTPGTFDCDPSVGTALTTRFTLNVSGWQNAVAYSFGYIDSNKQRVYLSVKSESIAVVTYLAAGNVTLFVEGVSTTGNEVTMTYEVKVSPLQSDQLLDTVTDLVNNLNNTADTLSVISVISDTIKDNRNNANSTAASQSVTIVVDVVFSNTSIFTGSSEASSTVVTVMDKLTEEPSLISANTGEKITSILSAILSDKTIVLSNRTLSQVTNTARHVESVMLTSTSSTTKRAFNTLISNLMDVNRKQTEAGSKVQIRLNNLVSEVVKEIATSTTVLQSTVTDTKLNAQLTTNANSAIIQKVNGTVSLEIISYSFSIFDNTSLSSSIVRVKVFVNDEEFSANSRRSLTDDQIFETTLPVEPKTSSNSTYTCRYWDDVEQKWQNDTSVCSYSYDEQNNLLSCSCVQSVTIGATLDYVQAVTNEEDDPPPRSNKKLSPGVIAAIVIIIVTISIAFAVCLIVTIIISLRLIRKKHVEDEVELKMARENNLYSIWYSVRDFANRVNE